MSLSPPTEPQPAPPPTPAAPVAEPQRIQSMDVLRGAAVLGILLMNIQSFSMPSAAYLNPTAYGTLEGADGWVWRITHVLADQKFIAIFSMLFGAGVVLMTGRAEARTGRSGALHYRRMGWLMLLGVAHAHLLWYGDILYAYGLVGLLAWLLRKAPPGVLAGVGAAVIAAGGGLSLLTGLSMGYWPEQAIADLGWMPPADVLNRELERYRGSWMEQMGHRVPMAFFFETFLMVATAMGWKICGMILLGMGLFKWGVFSGERSPRTYWILLVVGLGAGVPLSAWGIHQNQIHGWDVRFSMFFGSLYNYFASMFTSLGWVGGCMLLCRIRALGPVLHPLAATGRMALSNYLMQTLICTTIFYGHGLGLFGTLSRLEQLGVVLGVWAFQLALSPLWLTAFRYGPAEWAWRCLTYLRREPFRRRGPHELTGG
jgi:uncharacterized protein